MMDAVLDVRDVTKTYAQGNVLVAALAGVSLSLGAGSTVALMGQSGSGKTTLLNLIAGLDQPTRGEVWLAGTCLSRLDADAATVFRRRHIGFVFQFFNLLPTMTARDNVGLPLLAERLPRTEVNRRAMEALEAIGLSDRAGHRPAEMSGGEMQRVAIARALVMRPKLLLADEPTGNLDTATGDEILSLMRQAVDAYGLSIVMVTHSYLAAAAMDRILFIRDGRLVDEVDVAGGVRREAGARLQVVRPRPLDAE
jgi:putative ABC transport system ATP-binding protein